MRKAAAVDANQSQVVEAFRKLGCLVYPTHQLGRGFPDIAVKCGDRLVLVEIKDGSKPPSARKLTDAERIFHDAWAGVVEIVETLDDVTALVGRWGAGL